LIKYGKSLHGCSPKPVLRVKLRASAAKARCRVDGWRASRLNNAPRRATAKMADRVFGRHPVAGLLAGPRRVFRVFLAEGLAPATVRELADLAAAKGAAVEVVARGWLDSQAAGVTHQGVMAEAEGVQYLELDELLATIPAREMPFLVALDQVQDPHNLGAIIRTAAAAGAHGLVIPERRSASLSPGTLKAAAGAADWFPVARVVNLARALDTLKKQNLWAVGADGAAPQNYWEVDLVRPLVLVVGGEDRGVGRLVREKCDLLARLPMRTEVPSLNASVAAAIMIYETVRQRAAVVSGRPALS